MSGTFIWDNASVVLKETSHSSSMSTLGGEQPSPFITSNKETL